jgi:hypothetical protein
MGRKKENDRERLLTQRVQVKLTSGDFDRIHKLRQTSDCKSVSELVRRILTRRPITMLTKDTTLDVTMEELIRLRKELHFIGHNINQITHHFHSANFPKDKLFYALKVTDEFDKMQQRLNAVMSRITELGKLWLQK